MGSTEGATVGAVVSTVEVEVGAGGTSGVDEQPVSNKPNVRANAALTPRFFVLIFDSFLGLNPQ